MSNFVRAFALSLVVTGAFASAHISKVSNENVLSAKVSAMPMPCCPPDDPAACHIAQGN